MNYWELDKNTINHLNLKVNYYVDFRANTLGKGMNPIILPAMG